MNEHRACANAQLILFDLISTIETIDGNTALNTWKGEVEAGTKVKIEEHLTSAKAELILAYDTFAEEIGDTTYQSRGQAQVFPIGPRPALGSIDLVECDDSVDDSELGPVAQDHAEGRSRQYGCREEEELDG